MRRKPASDLDNVGRRLPGLSSALRPQALRELEAWGGEALVRDKRILDLGCGDGRLALGVASYASSIVGLDPDPDAVRSARKNARKARLGNATFAVGAAQNLRYPDHTFDVVILSWTL